MNDSKTVSWIVVLATSLAGCASAHPTPPAAPGAETPRASTTEPACAGIPEQQQSTNLCLDTEDILRVERTPVASRAGDVLTGARMVFRGSAERSPQAFQKVVDCQIATNLAEPQEEQYRRMSYCPLAVRGITAKVQPTADGLAIEVRPSDASSSRRLSHALAHGTAALQLARFESAECRGIEPRARAACPLLGPVTAITDTPDGVRVDFHPSVPVDGVLAAMRCHYSFAEARGFSEEAAACPLYVRGLGIRRSSDAKAIDITIRPSARVKDVRQRVREEAIFVTELSGPRAH